MRRALSVAVLLALACAAPAAADVPFVHGSAIGGNRPLHASVSLAPPVQLFGDAVTAVVSVVADTRWVDPARLRARVDFAPYRPVEPPKEVRVEHGRLLHLTWTWTLRCLTAACVPTVPPSDLFHVFRFQPARIDYLGRHGTVAYTVDARVPRLEALSQLSPAVVSYLTAHHALDWQYQLTPGAVRYRISPAVVFWAALALACVLGAAAIVVLARWARRLRARAPAAARTLPSSSLERALALFFWARSRGDETLQRKALERVAAELPLDVTDLSEAARALAWSPEAPEGEEVEAISARAGVHAHRNGRDA